MVAVTTTPTRPPVDPTGRGNQPKAVQEMLGHTNISQTMDAYDHILPGMESVAVDAMESTPS